MADLVARKGGDPPYQPTARADLRLKWPADAPGSVAQLRERADGYPRAYADSWSAHPGDRVPCKEGPSPPDTDKKRVPALIVHHEQGLQGPDRGRARRGSESSAARRGSRD